MTKEDIITTAIHEAFLCGKEAGEAYERAYHIMQKKVEEAKKGKPDFDQHMYDGIFNMLQKVETGVEESQRTSSESYNIDMEREELERLKDENRHLQRQCEEKDAIITEMRQELEKLHATVPDASTSGGKSSCAHLYDGDQVLVIGAFFGNDVPSLHATILEVTDSMALVLITEKDSDFENDEHYVPYEYITKQ